MAPRKDLRHLAERQNTILHGIYRDNLIDGYIDLLKNIYKPCVNLRIQ